MHNSEAAVGPLFYQCPKLFQPCLKYAVIVSLSIALRILVDVVQLSLAILPEVKSYEIDIFVSMHAGGPHSGLSRNPMRIVRYEV